VRSKISCTLAGISGIRGVLLLGLSFAINNGLPRGASDAQLLEFAKQVRLIFRTLRGACKGQFTLGERGTVE
jgi:hypothetical protein